MFWLFRNNKTVMWLFVNNQPCFGYIKITTLNNKSTFGPHTILASNTHETGLHVKNFIIHPKYFPVSDWLKPHAQFTITSCC